MMRPERFDEPRRLRTPRCHLLIAVAAAWMVWLGGLAVQAADENEVEVAGQAVAVRLLPILQHGVEGKAQVEALVIDPEVRELIFYLDGEDVARRKRPPWNVKVPFASPAREQSLRVVAQGPGGRSLGDDTLVVNRRDPAFRVRITAITGDAVAGDVVIEGEVTLPRKGELETVRVLLNDRLVGMVEQTPFSVPVHIDRPTPEDIVQVEAILEDGRRREDLEVLRAPGFTDEVDVNLVQLQVLVTRKNGAPVADLKRDDFEVRQEGKVQPLQQLYVADDVSLVLGLALDSSGSMQRVWRSAQEAAGFFLQQTLQPRDRAFLVDFNTELSLVQPLTDDGQKLQAGLQEIRPEGGTALYDAVLFSLMQYADEPGRRALVVLTDGFDIHSQANPKRTVEMGRRLGVPVYIIAMPSAGGAASSGPGVQELKLLTEPTGGRLLRLGSGGGLERAFRHINLELRHQYVLTYYAEDLPADRRGAVKVTVPGRKDLEVRAVIPLDQVQRAEPR